MTISKAIQELKTGTCYECAYGTSAAYECSGENPTCPFKKAIHIAVDLLSKYKWTPVSECFPEPWASVLITFSGKYGSMTADHAVGTGSYDGSYGWFIDEIQGYTDRLTVEAWMNLPESYKGE